MADLSQYKLVPSAVGTINLVVNRATIADTASSVAYADVTGKPTLFTANQSVDTTSDVTFHDLNVTGAVTLTTTDIGEGANLYYTDTRARNAISVAGSGSYNNTTGVITVTGGVTSVNTKTGAVTVDTDDISEGTSNLYFTTARSNTAFDNRLSVKSTTNLTEGTNLYYTDTRANTAFDTRLALKSSTDLAEGTNLYYTSARISAYLAANSGNISAGNVTVQGNLNVTGTTVTTNQSTLTVTDNKITLNSGATGVPTLTASIDIDRGSSATTRLRWNESTDKWEQTRDGTTYVDLPINTTELTEGTNLYFTNARARSAVSVTGDLSYNSSTGVISFTQNNTWGVLTGTPTTISGYGITDAYTKTEVDSAITTAVAGKDNTDEITEGSTNLYFTTARARGAVSAGTGITYSSSTGVIAVTNGVYTTDTGTVTNTMLAGSIATSKITGLATSATTDTTNAGNITSGTLPNARLVSVPNSALANSTISGKALGTNLDALTIGTGLSGTSYNGTSAVTVAIDSTVATLTDTQTLTNKTISTATNTISGLTNTNLSGSAAISNANLANSKVTIGTTDVSLGATATTLAGLTNVSADSITVNGQPTTYGYVNGAYLLAQNTTDQSVGLNVAVNFQTTSASNGSIITKTSNSQVTLTAGNTYKLEGIIRRLTSSSTWAAFRWYDVTNSAYVGIEGFSEVTNSTGAIGSTCVATYIVTPTVNTTYELRQTTVNTISVSGGYAGYEITQLNPSIAVQATATGTVSTNYAKYTRTASQSVSANSVIVCNVSESTSGSSISVNTSTGQVTLTAGKTYRLRGTAGTTAGSSASSLLGYGWYNETTSAWIGEGAGLMSPASTNFNTSTSGTAEVVITVSSTTVVSLRVILATNVTSIGGNQSDFAGTYANPWIDIEEIGASFALNALDTISTTGNVSVGGNLNVTGTSTSLVRKASGVVNAGVDVTLGNLKARIPSSGNRSLQLSTVSGTYSVTGGDTYNNGSIGSSVLRSSAPRTINTTPAYMNPNYNFTGDGDSDVWTIYDAANSVAWRITYIIGSGYANNMISIEQLV